MTDIVYGIRITGDATGAKRAFDETRGAQDKLTGAERENARAAVEVERAKERQVASLNRLRLAALAAGAAMLAMLRSTISAAVEAERSIARLNAVWRATGGTTGLSRGQHEALAQRMAGETRFDDEQIRDAMAQLATFRQVSGETFVETMNVAASLAEVMNTDLKGAILQLGKALEDPVRGMSELRRVGVSFGKEQEEVIKNLVETGRQAEAMTMMLQVLKEQGLDGVAQAMNQGLARATTDFTKEWNDLLEAFGRTRAVQGPVTSVLGSITSDMREIKDLIERGTWWQQLARVLSLAPVGGFAFRALAQVGPAAVDDGSSPEAAAARGAAQQAQWQKSFDAQQAQAREFLKKFDEEEKKRGQARLEDQKRTAAEYVKSLEMQQDVLGEASALGVQFLKQQEEKRLALEKEGEAVRDVLNPWNAYAREVERLRGLLDKGAISQREFGEAVALEARKVGGAFDDMAGKGTQNFDELKDAIEGWGQDLSRELARGEVSLRSFGRLFEELLAMQIQRRIMQPFLSAGTSFIDSLLAPSTAGAYTGNAAPFHAGGIVGLEGGARRYVHPAYFERAPRLHAGGLAGGEVPAILRRGEGVFTPEQMRAMGGSNVTVNVINESGVQLEGQASAPRVDASGVVVDLVLRRLAVDGGARQQLRAQLSRPEH